jgi:excisionase family DNA binding protein
VAQYPHTEERTEYLMSPGEVAKFLGRTRTYELLSAGIIPSVRIGRLRRVRREDLEAFIEARRERDEHGGV